MPRVRFKHKIYCETESKWIFQFKNDSAGLTECPNNAGHTVTADSASFSLSVDTSVAALNVSLPALNSEVYAQGDSSTAYWHYGGFWGTEARSQVKMRACNVKEISGYFNNNLSGGGSPGVTITLRKNGSDTSMSGVISSTGRFSITGSETFDNGDLLSIKVVTTGNGGNISLTGGKIEVEVL